MHVELLPKHKLLWALHHWALLPSSSTPKTAKDIQVVFHNMLDDTQDTKVRRMRHNVY
jgi:hypothetical protein